MNITKIFTKPKTGSKGGHSSALALGYEMVFVLPLNILHKEVTVCTLHYKT